MLIMASIDHTARIRALVRNEPKSKSTSTVGKTLPRGEERERQRAYESRRAGTALAVAVIEGMLKTDSTFKQMHQNGAQSGLLPLNPVQLIGLENAIDLLHHYVDILSPGKSG
jgi:hypothetical protein